LNIIFSKLKLKNFKGVKDFEINFNNGITKIIGENAKGKTTLLDATYWIFFGKNSSGSKKFDLQPLDENNEIIPKKYPEVSLDLVVDGQEINLKKIQKSSCEYYYDEHPVKANEYESKISEIIDEKLFSTLINPVFFGDQLTWQEQKALILNNFEVEDTVILDDKYTIIKSEISTYGVDSTLAKYEKKYKDLDKEIIGLKSTKDYIVKSLDGKSVSKDKSTLSEELGNAKDRLKQFSESRDRIMELEREKLTVDNSLLIERNNFDNELKNKKLSIEREISTKEHEKSMLLNNYKEVSKKLKSIVDTCAYCGNKISAEKVDSQKEQLKSEMDEIVNKGNVIANEIQLLKEKLLNISDKFTPSEDLIKKQADLEGNIKTLKSSFNTELYDQISREIGEIESTLSGFETITKFQTDLDKTNKDILTKTDELEDAEIKVEKIKEYNREYSKLVADKLNELLTDVQINTFITQKNGTVKETFEITMFGVPYKSLNSAGKIIAGVELIRLINSALDINFPIVIDNKEGITKDFNIPNQLITLEVVKGAELSVRD